MLTVIDGESLVGGAGFRSGDEGLLTVPGERGCGEGEGEDPVCDVLTDEGERDLIAQGRIRSEAQTVSIDCIAMAVHGGY